MVDISITTDNTIFLTEDINSNGNTISFHRPVIVAADPISITTNGGNINFDDTLDSNTGSEDLTLTLGTGSATFTGIVGGTNPPDAFTINSAADVTFNQTVAAASLTQSAGSGTTRFDQAVGVAGNVDLNGTNFTVNSGLTTSGGGTVTITNSGTLTIADTTDAGDLATADLSLDGAFTQDGGGGVSTAGDVTTTGDTIQFTGPVTLTGNVALNTGGDADITFRSTVDGESILSFTAGNGIVTFDGEVGAVTPLDHVRIMGAGGLTNSADSLIRLGNQTVYVDADGFTIRVFKDLTVGSLVFYRGTLDLGQGLGVEGVTLTANNDFVVFGTNYYPDDGDWDANGDGTLTDNDDNRFAYPDIGSLVYYPGGGTYTANGTFSTATNGAFSDMAPTTSGATIATSGNFYVNGTDMTGTNGWTLVIPDNSASDPYTNTLFGTPYAVAFNMMVYNCDASNGGANPNSYVNAASWVDAGTADPDPPTGPGTTETAKIDAGDERNNFVWDDGGNTNWQFERPQIRTAETVYDNVIRITLEDASGTVMAIENSSNEISSAVSAAAADSDPGSVWCNTTGADGEIKFTGTFTDAECTTSTDGAGDLSTFYIQTTNTTWNTDATGTSAGDTTTPVRSTDRDGLPRNIIPDVRLLKGTFFAAAGKTFGKHYGKHTFPVFDDTTDECRPIIVEVTVGKHSHNAAADRPYDAHNYFHLRYSEPVLIGDIGAADSSDVNVVSDTVVSGGGHGGHIVQSGSNVGVAGYFTYPGTFKSGLMESTGTGSGNALHRHNANGENPDGPHGLTIFISGYSTGSGVDRKWPQYQWDVTNPIGQTITRTANTDITDRAAARNPVEPESAGYRAPAAVTLTDVVTAGTMTGFNNDPLRTFDEEEPYFSIWDSDDRTCEPQTYEIVTGIDVLTQKVNRLEFHIQDNPITDEDRCNPQDDLPDTDPNHGVRESSLGYTGNEHLSFKIGEVGDTTLVNTYNQPPQPPTNKLPTSVDNVIFGTISSTNDPFFALELNTDHNWTSRSSLILSYTGSSDARITDLAGNLLQDTPPEGIAAIERTPPRIDLTMGAVGLQKVFVRFTEAVFGDAARGEDIDKNDFEFSGGSISSIEVITRAETNGIFEAWFILSSPLTANQALSGTIRAFSDSVFDYQANAMSGTVKHRITDIGTGVVVPVWAGEQVHSTDITADDSVLLKDFDGDTEDRLMDRDITLEVSILASDYINRSVQLFYDVDSPEAKQALSLINEDETIDFWLPNQILGFVEQENDEARGLLPFRSAGGIRDFLIPADDPEIETGVEIEFILRIGDLYCARLRDPTDPRSVGLWRIPIRSIIEQRSGVTILNNVINPVEGEKSVLTYELEQSGLATIQVFSLDGDIVKVLHRGRQGAGTYTFIWDGKNEGGRIVARGIYFLRIVAPGIDEYRKILVVK